jgi:hypothetical protein
MKLTLKRHHWTIEAFDELSQRDDMRHTWRVDAPRHAVAHTFLMHEILAFAALHKAYRVPEQRTEYYTMGIHHQDLSIRGVREKLQNVTSHEAAAIVATSTLLTLSVFASSGFELNFAEISSSQSAIDGILNIFNLMQGMGNVLALAQAHVTNSFLAPMFRDAVETIPSQPMLQELIQQLPNLSSFIDNRSELPVAEREEYRSVIGHFEPVLRMAILPMVDNRELRFLFFWPLHIGPTFLTFVRERRSGALTILMYYATVLYVSQSRYWFMQGWGKQLMRACFEKLDHVWKPAAQWPASFLSHQSTWSLFSNLVHSRHGPGVATQAPDSTPFAYGQRDRVDMPHRHHAATPPQSYQPETHLDRAVYSQHGANLTSTQEQKPSFATHIERVTHPPDNDNQ